MYNIMLPMSSSFADFNKIKQSSCNYFNIRNNVKIRGENTEY